jgi:DNA (cytosine-5)-methyltransferase 1
MTLTYGSLCSGYGGLDLAVEAVFGAEPLWHFEVDPHASKVLAAHWPDVPNHGDLTATDWTTVAPVDVICGGYPCQPFSHAGQRKGTTDDRHIWPHIADALRVLRPRYAVFENVAGHVSLGFDAVLADLAEIGFDAEWVTVRASDVGACHRRERLFILAADADRGRRPQRPQLDGGADQVPAVELQRRASSNSGTP